MPSGAPADRPPFLIRQAGATDTPFIRSVWCREAEGTEMGRASGSGFRATHHAWAAKILARPDVVLLVASTADHPADILGVAVYEPHVLHLVYVRPPLRGFGVATALLGGWKGTACSLRAWKSLSYLPSSLWDASASPPRTSSTP